MTEFDHEWAAPMATIDELPRLKVYDERDQLKARLATAYELLVEVRPIIGSDELHGRVEAFLAAEDACRSAFASTRERS